MWMGDIDAKLHAKTEDLHTYRLKPCQSVNFGATQTSQYTMFRTYLKHIYD